MGRPQRKRRVAERVRDLDASELEAARVRRLDAWEADTNELPEASLSDEEYNPLGDAYGSDEDDDGISSIPRSAADPEISHVGDEPMRQHRGKRARRTARGYRERKPSAGIERWNKSLQQALDEDAASGVVKDADPGSYYAIAALPSFKPPRHFCSVCGYEAPYTCVRCVVRFCSVKCGSIHEETRCLKFTL